MQPVLKSGIICPFCRTESARTVATLAYTLSRTPRQVARARATFLFFPRRIGDSFSVSMTRGKRFRGRSAPSEGYSRRFRAAYWKRGVSLVWLMMQTPRIIRFFSTRSIIESSLLFELAEISASSAGLRRRGVGGGDSLLPDKESLATSRRFARASRVPSLFP